MIPLHYKVFYVWIFYYLKCRVYLKTREKLWEQISFVKINIKNSINISLRSPSFLSLSLFLFLIYKIISGNKWDNEFVLGRCLFYIIIYHNTRKPRLYLVPFQNGDNLKFVIYIIRKTVNFTRNLQEAKYIALWNTVMFLFFMQVKSYRSKNKNNLYNNHKYTVW